MNAEAPSNAKGKKVNDASRALRRRAVWLVVLGLLGGVTGLVAVAWMARRISWP